MRQFARIALASSLLLSTVACAQPVATPVASTPAVTTAATASKAHASGATVAAAIAGATNPLVKDLGHADGAAVAVTVKSPADRAILALQHRWLVKDVVTYAVTLLSADANGAYTTTVATLSIDAKAYNTSTTAYKALAAFTGLEANKKYQVTVVAWGSNASTPATEPNQVLNTQTAAEAFFDFTENDNGDIETAPPAQDVSVVLDSFEFSGSASINTKVTEGAFKPAAGGVKAEAIAPKVWAADWFSAWGYDIVSFHFSNFDMTTKVQGDDGNWYTPTGVEAIAMDGNYYGPQHANYNGMAAPNGEGRLQWWYWAGTWSGTGTTRVGLRAVYQGNGVFGAGPIQAENKNGIPQWWL